MLGVGSGVLSYSYIYNNAQVQQLEQEDEGRVKLVGVAYNVSSGKVNWTQLNLVIKSWI